MHELWRTLWAALILALLLGGTSAWAQELNYRVSAPPGWKLSKNSDGYTLVPNDLPQGVFYTVSVGTDIDYSGPLDTLLEKTAQSYLSQYNIALRGSEPSQLRKRDPATEIGLKVVYGTLRETPITMVLVALRQKGRVVMPLLLSTDDQAVQTHLPQFTQLLSLVQFKDIVTPAKVGTPGAVILRGWYVHRRAGTVFPTVGGGLASECPGNMCWEFLFFSEGGQLTDKEPTQGLPADPCATPQQRSENGCLPYLIRGQQLLVGSRDPVGFSKNGQKITVDGTSYEPLPSFSGVKLEGTYRSDSFIAAMVGTGGVSETSILTFTSAGRFTFGESRAVGINTGAVSVTGGTSQPQQGGRYQLAGNTLTLLFEDGKVHKLFVATILNEQGKPHLGSLLIGGNFYLLK